MKVQAELDSSRCTIPLLCKHFKAVSNYLAADIWAANNICNKQEPRLGLYWKSQNPMIAVVATYDKGVLICEKTGGILHSLHDLVLHVEFIFCVIPGNHDLESHIPILVDVMSHSDGGKSAMAEFILYAVCLNENLSDACRTI